MGIPSRWTLKDNDRIKLPGHKALNFKQRLFRVGLNDWLCGFVIMFSIFLSLISLYFFSYSPCITTFLFCII